MIRVGVWSVSVIAALIWIVLTVQIHSDLSLFLPRQQTFTHKLLINQLNQGSATRAIFVTIGSGDLSERINMSKRLALELKSSGLFDQVLNGDRALSERELDKMLEYRYLLSPNIKQDYFSQSSLRTMLNQRLDELSLPISPPNKKYLPRDPGADFVAVLKGIRKADPTLREQGVWVSEDKQQAILLLRTAVGAVDLDNQQKTIDSIQDSFDRLNTSGNLSMELTGVSVASNMSRSIIQAEARWFSLIATTALMIILLLAFRSFKLFIVGAMPLLTAVVSGLTVVLLWFGSIHGITLVFAVTILGMAIDYPIHLYSHLTKKLSAFHSVEKIWGTMLTGLVTTAMAFLTLAFSNFDGLYQLGLFTSTGLVMAVLTTRYVLPVLVGHTVPLPYRGFSFPQFSSRWVITAVALSVAFVVSMLSFQAPQWEQSLASLSPLPKSYIQRDNALRSRMGVGDLRYVALIEGQTLEEVLQKSEIVRPHLDGLVRDGVIRDYDMAAKYLPSQQLQRQRIAVLPEPDDLVKDLTMALQELPFKKDLFNPFLEDVEKSAQLPVLQIGDMTGMVFEPLIESLVVQIDGLYYGLVNVSGNAGKADVEKVFAVLNESENSPDVLLYDLKTISSELLQQFYLEFFEKVMIAVALISLILALVLRDLPRTLVVVGILCLSLTVEVAVMVALGHAFTLFHLVSLILVFGLGLDYALFFTRKESGEDKQNTSFGLLICLLSSIFVFGILSLSSIPVLHIIGLTTAVGVVLSFVFSMLVSPLVATRS